MKLVTLNIEGDKHLDKVLSFLKAEKPDAVCLQEVFAADVAHFESELGMTGHFATMTRVEEENRYGISPRGEWGIALFSHLPLLNVETLYYRGIGSKPVFTSPNSPDRVVLSALVELSDQRYSDQEALSDYESKSRPIVRLATTHFTWSAQGKSSAEQRHDFQSLARILDRHEDWVLCGDFNAPRGGEIFHLFAERLQDSLPLDVTTTLDPNLHYAGPLDLAVDTIFSTHHYRIESVRVVAGLSDHQAIVGLVSTV
jgi:endonuclease/exonuclease/phosphatase family metal-dependent hydrolase